jgi:protein-S-isoprenylcysteine O-methyltransferase Ste14
MIANKHAETMVRIQEERDHRVASGGPYRFVRHPMYVSILLTQLAYPIAVGSLCAYVPVLESASPARRSGPAHTRGG